MTRDQVIVSAMGEIVDISIPAIKTVMDLYGVTDQKTCLRRVIDAFRRVQAEKRRTE